MKGKLLKLLTAIVLCLSTMSVSGIVSQPVAHAKTRTIVLATTTSTYDSGLLGYLVPIFQKKKGIKVKIVSVGTGQAITYAQQGNADVILVHDRAKEDKFVSDGYGDYAYDVMRNQFFIVGPSNDPAGIKGMLNATDALKKIAKSQSKFISRADNSGTNSKEKALWAAAGITPSGSWYIKAGVGMGETLQMADQMNAYTLTDEATYYATKSPLKSMVNGSSALLNPYGVIRVKKSKKQKEAKAFIDFLVSPTGQKYIGNYGVKKFGKKLFVPQAKKR